MTVFRKLSAGFLGFGLLLSLLSGCGSSDPSGNLDTPTVSKETPGPSATEPAAATPETAAPTSPVPSETVPAESQPQEMIQPEPSDEDFVRIRDYIPDVVVELPYASNDNFTGQVIYDFTEPWLRYGTVKKLMLVQEELKEAGLYLKIWDGFRPVAAQFKLWEVCPDPTYVSDPNKGFSSHSRGNAVDVTLTDLDGNELEMPTGFDDFSSRADRDYSDCTQVAAGNALLLENLMTKYGFRPYYGEWWHFYDTDSYPVEESFQPTE